MDLDTVLIKNGWPQSGEPNQALTAKLKYLETIKRDIRLAYDKAYNAKSGKKKGK